EDVMSRISHIQLNPGSGAEMTARVRRAIGQLAADCAAEAGLDPSAILELAVVGNPAMHHLFLGLDALPLGPAPFPLAVADAVTRRTGELDLELPAAGHVYVLPCIAGHVGADAAAVILSEAPHRGEEMTLVIDIGTNAEIVLGNRDRLLACSSPTGPAFEGAQISAGQRATPGAIERLRVDRDGLAPRFKVIGCDLWSDQPGFAEAVAETGITGICGSGIIEAVAELFLAGAIAADGRMVDPADGASPHLLPDGKNLAYLVHAGPPELRISQADIRAIQLAKAAAYAGARLLMERLGVRSLDRIVLTGGFGSYLDPTHAMVLGLIPNCPLERVSAAGNAAGTGARIALLDRGARAEIEALVRQVEKVETAVEPDFQDHFVAAMALPHRHDAFPDLAKVVDLPPPPVPSGRRRRRSG
ncbi:MAG: ASKHA domain-containing protein, partial [Alphaproteobacteria bacterium]|nr:ASKHA domain-containing protein [Alphaproteobacteria bacterium]